MQYQVQPKSRHTPVAFGFLLLYMAALSTLLWKIGFGISPEEQELLAVFLYQLLVLTTIKNTQERSFLGKQRVVPTVQRLPNEDTIIEKDDILVLYGANTDLQKFARLT